MSGEQCRDDAAEYGQMSDIERTPFPETAVKTMKQAIKDFSQGADQFDDITMVSFLYKGV